MNAAAVPSGPRFAYVGSRTTRERDARGEGIGVYRLDGAGGLARVQQVGGLENPSFLALNRAKDRLYTVHGDGAAVSVFAADPRTGTLSFLQRRACGGRNPVHLALDPSERWLVVSDHLGVQGGGSVLVMPVGAEGTLGAVSQRVELPGAPGPHRQEQPHAKPHFNPFDPSGRYILVPDKGLDRVFVFRFEAGVLTPAAQPWMPCRDGAGPRHLAFHPAGRLAYVANELDATVVACRFDPRTGELAPFQLLSSLPDHVTGNSRSAEIEAAPDGRTLDVSNRGHDSLAVFSIEATTGRLRLQDTVATAARTPRFFAIAPGGRHLFVLNEDSDTIVSFPRDGATGALGAPVGTVACGSPVCMVF